MLGTKTTTLLQVGDILFAQATVSALENGVPSRTFFSGQELGVVTNAGRSSGNNTFVDFTDAYGRALSIDKQLTIQPLASVGYKSNPNYNYGLTANTSLVSGDTTPKGARTSNVIDKILSGLDSVARIITGVKSTAGNSQDGSQSDSSSQSGGVVIDGGKQLDEPKKDNTTLYLIVGGVAIVGVTIAAISYFRKKRKKAQ